VAPDQQPLHERLSVVLLTYNCAHRLPTVLDHLLDLGIPVIAVDNASSDETRAVLANYPRVETVQLTRNIGAAGRNVGLLRAATPYVAFCDDDGWYEPDGLAVAADALDRYPELALVSARILVGANQHLDPICALMADSPLRDSRGIPGPVLLGFMAGACVVRVSAYLDVGGYDPIYFIGGEEQTLSLKLAHQGWQLRYLPDVVVHHQPSRDNAPQLRAHELRNTLWTCWLYRSRANAVRATLDTLVQRPKNIDWFRGIAMALRGLGWVRHNRRPLPAKLDQALRTLDAHRSAFAFGEGRLARRASWHRRCRDGGFRRLDRTALSPVSPRRSDRGSVVIRGLAVEPGRNATKTPAAEPPGTQI
jgi:N-acetylglucosaminyl-diphospho-decaprenol L-rhamnosyltransferase